MMNRGRRREAIFAAEGDYHLFLELLQETTKMWNMQVSAYCLMSNHYHLLVQTPEGNLSRCMRHLNGVYTQRFNRKHNHDGQLFRGRYKAVLVEEDSHLLELLRYIHRNPLEAGIVTDINDYHWNSHQGYLDNTRGWNWLYRKFLLKMFAKSQKKAQVTYLEFVNRSDSEEIEQFYSRKNLPSIFGSIKFIDKIKNRFESLSWNKEIPAASVLSVDAEAVIRVVQYAYQITEKELLTTKRGTTNIPRDLAIYTLRTHSRKTLSEIGAAFWIENYSTVSSAIDRAKKILEFDVNAQRKFKRIEDELRKGQQQT